MGAKNTIGLRNMEVICDFSESYSSGMFEVAPRLELIEE